MKHVLKGLVVFALAIVLAAPLMGADEKKPKGEKKEKPSPGAQLVKQAMGRLKNIDLNAEQKEKIEKIAAEWAPKIMEARKASGMSPEQAKARREAMAKAKADGLGRKEAAEAVNAAVKLTDEQKEQLGKVRELSQGFQKAVAGVLSEEQRAKLGGGRKKAEGKKPQAKKADGEKKKKEAKDKE